MLHTTTPAFEADMNLEPDYHTDFIDVYVSVTRAAIAQRSGRADQLDIIRFS